MFSAKDPLVTRGNLRLGSEKIDRGRKSQNNKKDRVEPLRSPSHESEEGRPAPKQNSVNKVSAQYKEQLNSLIAECPKGIGEPFRDSRYVPMGEKLHTVMLQKYKADRDSA
jgi:hypothetical protein